jgi:DNA-binding transcriptional regulator YhcF (GntR family)
MDFGEEKSIYLQIAEKIEDAILSGAFREEEQIPSTTEFSVSMKINPATALKGINLLTEEGIVFKKRGLGMFVSPGAKERILSKRKKDFSVHYVQTLLSEAKKLKIGRDEIIAMIERGYDHEQN